MKYTDHHVHTRFSPDAKGNPHEYITAAKKLGLDFIIFTDHVDFGGTDKDFMKHIDYDNYFQLMKELEEEYGIAIKIGVEIGYEKNYKEEIQSFLDRYDFDYVISSIHYGDRMDFYSGDFFHGKSQEKSYLRYFEILLEMVENFHNYDVVGHLDYIIRYGPFKKKFYNYKDYKEIIDKILTIIVKKGKGIELNTSGLREEMNTFYPRAEILERYKELGGKTITIGSDAHYNKDYYAGIREGIGLLQSLGYEGVSYFKKREEGLLSFI